MLIKIEKNKNVVTYQFDDSVQGAFPEPPQSSSESEKIAAGLFSGMPTCGITTDAIVVDYCMYINLNAISEIRVIENFDNQYALSTDLTDDCKKLIAFGRGLQSTIFTFNSESEGEFQRIKREIEEFSKASKNKCAS